jgi:hypothetical protein
VIGAEERFVQTADIRAAVKERETHLLDALNIDWRAGQPHITCPYKHHADSNPSWRCDRSKRRAFCTCGTRDALGVLVGVEAIEFAAAKIRGAELLDDSGCDLAGYAAAKKLPVDFLRSLGVLVEIEPWPEAVNGTALLDDTAATVREYVVLSARQADTTALWASPVRLVGSAQ